MKIEVQITPQAIEPGDGGTTDFAGTAGAIAKFAGVVRDEEDGERIAALEYEAFSPMAANEMRRILTSLAKRFPCLAAHVIHRVGIIPSGETAILVVILARHRVEAFGLLAEFMNRLKQDVPIWKRRALPLRKPAFTKPASTSRPPSQILSMTDARAHIETLVTPRPAAEATLEQAAGRILRETVFASEDQPAHDRSTRDGYAILRNDPSTTYQVIDTLHAADWRPRQLKTGEAVRVATGASLPCDHLQVIMQEEVERHGDQIKIGARDENTNLRKRGEEIRAGDPVLTAGARLNAGTLGVLATAGCVRPRVSPRIKVVHLMTGDEVVPPGQTPLPGQIRDSNSTLIRSWVTPLPADLWQQRLPENFERAKTSITAHLPQIENADLLLVSGGASVGDKDFTRALLEILGFEIVFHRVNLRPGAPLIFGVAGSRVAFGLPGNPLSHFAGWHTFVSVALARMTGARPPTFLQGQLATALADAECPRETLWPASCQPAAGRLELTPLRWHSAGDVSCLAAANALIRVPANTSALPAGATVEYLSITT